MKAMMPRLMLIMCCHITTKKEDNRFAVVFVFLLGSEMEEDGG